MQTFLIITGIFILLLSIYIYNIKLKLKKISHTTDHPKIITLTDQNFKHQVKDKLILIDFWANWCMPCRMMIPVLNDLANEIDDNTCIGKINVEEHQQLAQKFNIRNIPTLLLLKNGKEINRYTGVKSKDFLLKQIKNH